MRSLIIGLSIMLTCILLAQGGCAGRNTAGGTEAVPGISPQTGSFPPPSTLHGASYAQDDLAQWGAEYSDSLPHQNTWRTNEYALFSPPSAQPGGPLANLAYVTYNFQLDGYDLEPSLRFSWASTHDFANAWVGLADFPGDRWEWHALPENGCLAFDPARNISATGAMYVIVLITKQPPWQLQLLRVGPELTAPEIWLTASPRLINVPFNVNFNATGSCDPDGGSIVKYEWDWNGDGVYDADTGQTPTASHVYTEVGDYSAVLRVTDDENATSTKAILIQAISYHCDPDTLYAIPQASHAAVGEPVRILVATGQPAGRLQFADCITVSFESGGAYVPQSFNIGWPGGARLATDGYWELLGPPAPGNGMYLDIGDNKVPGRGSLPEDGLEYLAFAVVSQGPFDAPATIGNGATLFNFELAFSQPGTYHLGFIQYIGDKDMTHYADQDGHDLHWSVLDDSNTIVVE